MTQQTNPAGINPDEGIVIFSRSFDAPRDLVFKAWTEPERLMQWWGPKGFTMRAAKVDLRPGGVFHYAMTGPNDMEMWGKFVYREIDTPRRLSFVSSFSDAEGGTTRHPMAATWPLEVLSTLTFTEQGEKTVITGQAMPVNASAEEQTTFEDNETSVKAGFKGTLDQLEAYLAGVA
jgi:uncharacterized protein YndB with AHSA1/START domain